MGYMLSLLLMLLQTHIKVYILPSCRCFSDLMYFLSDMQTCESYLAGNPGMTVKSKDAHLKILKYV